MANADPAAGEAGAGSGVYVHLPFCSAICPYCDFSVTVGDGARREALVSAVVREIGELASRWERPVDSLYFGGGTPSLHTLDELARIVTAVRDELPVAGGVRVFLEANPEDVTAERLDGWRDLGVATLSLGLQSLEAGALRRLGRRHSPHDGRRAVRLARTAGFQTVSVDLIYARPGQTTDAWRRELEAVAALQPDHLSCYQLTVHEGTPFGRLRSKGRLRELPDGRQAELFATTHDVLDALGFEAYELSNFARAPQHRSRHNLKYWCGNPYVGFGPSAHSFDGVDRWWNMAAIDEYLRTVVAGRSPIAGRERLSQQDRLLEIVMLGLRRPSGVDLARLAERFGVDLVARNRERLDRWTERAWVRLEDGRLLPSVEGLLRADRLAAELDLGRLKHAAD